MTSNLPEEKWQIRLVRSGLPGLDKLSDLGLPDLSRLPWLHQPVLPAEIGNSLRDAMLSKENHLEDVNYQKIVPNRFMVEVNAEIFARHFRPIEGQIIKQWQDRLLEELITANSRQGRKEFRFGGRLRLEVRPVENLKINEARILSRIEPDSAQSAGTRLHPGSSSSQQPARSPVPPPIREERRPSKPSLDQIRPADIRPAGGHPGGTVRAGDGIGQGSAVPQASPDPRQRNAPGRTRSTQPPAGSVAYLELLSTGQTWALYPGVNTIGRSETCQIFLDQPVVQDRRLVSGLHAYIMFENGKCMLFDGSPDGRPSANGTYVNLRRVPPNGYHLQNGDAIVLAALDPLFPRSDTPGVATFYFWSSRKE